MTAQYGSLAFKAQIAFFRNKLNVPTAAWSDVWQAGHDTAFMVAGAAKADLLDDLRKAVAKGIEDGTTLAQFRKDFDALVEKNGWTGWTGQGSKKGRAWRTRIIYETNLRTSYAAGRWQQLQAGKAFAPYLQYIHDDSVRYPRPHHQAWHGTVLHIDDPWWQTHYPPNGWGCKCKVRSLTPGQLARRGLTPGTPPDSPIDPKTGGPEGIDAGWAYAPGASLPRQADALRAKAQKLPPAIKQALLADIDAALAGRGLVPPVPIKPKPKLKPKPKPKPKPKANAQPWDSSTPAGQWHEGSWGAAPTWLRRVVGDVGEPSSVTVTRGTGSYHRAGAIHMGYELGSSSRAQAVWRHEFGHYIDHVVGRRHERMAYSSLPEFTRAMQADAKLIADGSGRGRKSKKQAARLAHVQQTREGAVQDLHAAAEPVAYLRDLADQAGVDYDLFDRWTTENGFMATMPQGFPRRSQQARALVAMREGDAQGLLDAIDGVAVGDRAARYISYKNGAAGELSDLFSAATLKKVEGCGSHSKGYYRERRGRGQQSESWANVICLLGTGPVGRAILKRFTPGMLKELEEVLKP